MPTSIAAALPLHQGATGHAVRDLQRRLMRAGHDTGGDDPGVYGPATEKAVRAFQERRGLRDDGICGAQTWASLVEAGHRLGERLLYLRSPMLRGDDVAELQRVLGRLGFDAGKVDGILGPATAAAVTEFQRNAGLTTDGICGPDTVAALQRYRGRVEADGASTTVASLREAERLRGSSRRIDGLRVVVGDSGGAAALTDALSRALLERGALATVVRDPDESARAAAANDFDASVFLAVAVREEPGAGCAFYAHDGFESVGGRWLATLLTDALARCGVVREVRAPRGMRVPVLRETRMPAVVLELGPPTAAVVGAPAVVEAAASAVEAWASTPVES